MTVLFANGATELSGSLHDQQALDADNKNANDIVVARALLAGLTHALQYSNAVGVPNRLTSVSIEDQTTAVADAQAAYEALT